jgi:hypothetical protein
MDLKYILLFMRLMYMNQTNIFNFNYPLRLDNGTVIDLISLEFSYQPRVRFFIEIVEKF